MGHGGLAGRMSHLPVVCECGGTTQSDLGRGGEVRPGQDTGCKLIPRNTEESAT